MSKHTTHAKLAKHILKEGLNANRRRYDFSQPEYVSELTQLWSFSYTAGWRIDPASEVFRSLTGAVYGSQFVEAHVLALKRQIEFIDSYQKEHGFTTAKLVASFIADDVNQLPFSSTITALFLQLLASTFEQIVRRPTQANSVA